MIQSSERLRQTQLPLQLLVQLPVQLLVQLLVRLPVDVQMFSLGTGTYCWQLILVERFGTIFQSLSIELCNLIVPYPICEKESIESRFDITVDFIKNQDDKDSFLSR